MKKILLVLLALAVAFGAVSGWTLSASAAEKSYTWKISHVRPADTAVDKDMKWFAEKLAKESNGRITINIFGASQLGDYSVVQERISVGAVDMACQPLVAAADKRLMVSSFPYLADSWASARKIYVSGSPLMNTVGELIAKQDIKLLAVWPVYFGGIALKKAPAAPTDPNAKQGLKVRVPPIKSYQVLADALGYQATPLPFSEAFTAMQTGIVDGVVGSGAEGYYSNFRDVTKFYLPGDHSYRAVVRDHEQEPLRRALQGRPGPRHEGRPRAREEALGGSREGPGPEREETRRCRCEDRPFHPEPVGRVCHQGPQDRVAPDRGRSWPGLVPGPHQEDGDRGEVGSTTNPGGAGWQACLSPGNTQVFPSGTSMALGETPEGRSSPQIPD